MAAFASLTSLLTIIHQLQNHPSPPISIEKQQLESLTEIATFLQEFLQGYDSPVPDSDEADPLEMRIANAAYAAEDVIESYIVDNIKLVAETARYHDDAEQIRRITFYEDVQKVIEEMDLMAREVVGKKAAVKPPLQKSVSTSGGSSSSSGMVGFGDVSLELLDKLTSEQPDRQVIPVVGMAGIGKTTLAGHVYAHPLVKEHFDVCCWVTISQKHNTKKNLRYLVSQIKRDDNMYMSDIPRWTCEARKRKERLSDATEDELGLELHKCLFSRRFLIVMDDMWSMEAWDEMQRFFPDNRNRSRIVVTTRLSTLASQLDKSYCLKMKFLDQDSSWDLLSKTVFGVGEDVCPPELKEIGKKIVETCQGLPLPIVVMGGLLKNLEHTKQCWKSVSKKTTSLVNSENEDSCLKLLKMSYNHLPVHLKPCFLYMGMFEENSAVRVSSLVKLWVSEGFLKPVSGKSLETAARDYLNDLVDRNLVLVHEFGSIGNIKFCKIHDLLRDLCWREAGKEGFYDVIGQHKSPTRQQRRVFIRGSTSKEADGALKSIPLARSFLFDRSRVVSFPESRLLRILHANDSGTSGSQYYELDASFGFVNSRYLAGQVQLKLCCQFSPSIGHVWNLQTLIISNSLGAVVTAPVEIWKMSQLKHVEFRKGQLRLPEVPSGKVVIMKNIQTLKGLFRLYPKESYLFPNIKKLEVEEQSPYLKHLTELESCRCWRIYVMHQYSFPYSLKKLSLGSHVHWDIYGELIYQIRALPHLQKLKLERAGFRKWETIEDQFPSLKYLELKWCRLESWVTESSHFPRLEQLHLYGLKKLKEIPCEIGEIATLQSICLQHCSKAVVESAKQIAEDQVFQVQVVLFNTDENKALRSLASTKFEVEIVDQY